MKTFAELPDDVIATKVVGGLQAAKLELPAIEVLNVISNTLEGASGEIVFSAIVADAAKGLRLVGKNKEAEAAERIGGALVAVGMPNVPLPGCRPWWLRCEARRLRIFTG